MRHLLLAVLPLFVIGCTSSGGESASRRTADITGGPALSAEVFPFETEPMTFATRQGGLVGVRVEPIPTGARMWITGDFPQARQIDWRRDGDTLIAHDGPDRGVALMRFGAQPGEMWESSGQRITFEGWERVETAAGTFDAARITTEGGTDDLRVVETWWFAAGSGLVRYEQDRAGLFQLEMSRVR